LKEANKRAEDADALNRNLREELRGMEQTLNQRNQELLKVRELQDRLALQQQQTSAKELEIEKLQAQLRSSSDALQDTRLQLQEANRLRTATLTENEQAKAADARAQQGTTERSGDGEGASLIFLNVAFKQRRAVHRRCNRRWNDW
jgi:hypothetical protein